MQSWEDIAGLSMTKEAEIKPKPTLEEQKGLKDYWKIYEMHRAEIGVKLLRMARRHREFKFILQNSTSEPSAEQQADSDEIQRRAIYHGEWQPYIHSLQTQGMHYAQAGLSFPAWFEIVSAFRKYMLPYMMEAYGKSPKRLSAALNGIDTLFDLSLSVIGESYLETKQQLIQQQGQTIQRGQSQLAGIINSAMDAIITIDENQRILIFNPAAEKMFERFADNVIGKPLTMLIPERLRLKHEEDVRGFGKTSTTKRSMGRLGMVFGLRANGEEFPLEVSISKIEVDGKKNFTAILRDITERNRAEAEIQQLNTALEERVLQRTSQLEASNKELEAFSYSVSHDLRAPLRSIDGFSQALLEDYANQLPPEGQYYLERVRAAAQRMAALIDDLLNLSRVTRAPIQPGSTDLSAIARQIADELMKLHPERKIRFDIAPDLTVNGDSHLFQIVVENLLNNAWKFTSKREEARIEFNITNENGTQTFFVRDNGAGFDMKYADKLFGAFQRLHGAAEFPGTGIGLATVQRIIHKHGGRIWAEGAVDQGATFYFTV